MKHKAAYDRRDREDDVDAARAARESQLAFLRRAAQCAFRSNLGQRHGCVIVNAATGAVVSTGYNHKAEYLYHQFSIHAEVDALSKMKKAKLVDPGASFDMYVVRIGPESKGAPLRFSRPCRSCAEAIRRAPSVRRVFFSLDDETMSHGDGDGEGLTIIVPWMN